MKTLPVPLTIASLSHHTAEVAELESFRFGDEADFLSRARDRFRGVLLLQTCNRVEVLVEGERQALTDFLAEQGRNGYTLYEDREALRHLLELASGMDSLIVGEDQIIGQMRTALAAAEAGGTGTDLLKLCLDKAIHVGILVRQRTSINQGAVSIGSAAVSLAEQRVGGLDRKHILVVGAGEMGMLVAKALAAKGLSAIYVANRTYETAVLLAEKIGGRAIHLKDLYRYIALSDVVISCTSAPHPIIHVPALKAAMEERTWPPESHPHPLVIIDIAQPRDVEEEAGQIDGVRLFTVDDLREINETTIRNRKKEIEQARGIIDTELDHCTRLIKRASADGLIAQLYTWAEAIRARERDRAIHRMGSEDERVRQILDDLTTVLMKKLLADVTDRVRSQAENDELDAAAAIVRALTGGEPEPPSR